MEVLADLVARHALPVLFGAAGVALLGIAIFWRFVVACAPAPHAAVATMSPGGVRHDLSAIVREEIVKALGKP